MICLVCINESLLHAVIGAVRHHELADHSPNRQLICADTYKA